MQIRNTQHRWATFTYIGKETTYITKLFKHTNLKITYRTNNSIEQNLKPNPVVYTN
jgi:regulator of PEP synthase PpsR (kinase-PPPase family)